MWLTNTADNTDTRTSSSRSGKQQNYANRTAQKSIPTHRAVQSTRTKQPESSEKAPKSDYLATGNTFPSPEAKERPKAIKIAPAAMTPENTTGKP